MNKSNIVNGNCWQSSPLQLSPPNNPPNQGPSNWISSRVYKICRCVQKTYPQNHPSYLLLSTENNPKSIGRLPSIFRAVWVEKEPPENQIRVRAKLCKVSVMKV